MHPPGADTVLVRHGEVGVKTPQVQRKMELQLRDNLQALLADRGVPGAVERQHSRLFVRTDEEHVEAATEAAADAFGVVSASPAVTVEPTMDAITDALTEAAREHYQGGTFAVDARRAGEQDAHPFTSEDIEEEGGSAVWNAVGFEPAVDLDDPDVTVSVECRREEAYVFVEKREGPGGLPLGSQYPIVALISGGIDSPVAAWELMKRGCEVVPLYVDLGDFGGPDHRARAAASVGDLARYAPSRDMRMRVAPAGETIRLLDDTVGATRMLSLRRFMYMLAEELAAEEGAVGIVTGEAVGQKSSQTSSNLATTSPAVDLPVHRPLLTRDKTDITSQARAIGTFQTATVSAGCNRVAPSHPETNATLDQVRAAEPADLRERAREAVATLEYDEPIRSERREVQPR
ncbi:MAG: tRNA sulfurtransferase [Haloarculaceae archaeon]